MNRKQTKLPKTLQEAIVYFADPDNCLSYLVARRWPEGVSCPTCGRDDVSFVAARRVWQCKTRHPKAQFSVKVGTIFEDSPLGLDKWLPTLWMLANCKNGVSSWEIHRAIGVTQKTAWFMLHRIRLAMKSNSAKKLSGTVESDESFIGGEFKNMHKSRREAQRQRPMWGKAVVQGLLERDGEVRAMVLQDLLGYYREGNIAENVEEGSTIMTDKIKIGLTPRFIHEFVNHQEEYVRGNVHTQGIENFWSLLKRGLNGTYISVEPFHLSAYLDEQCFRYNNRKDMNDAGRFSAVVSQVAGKRLTYAELIGKVMGGEAEAN